MPLPNQLTHPVEGGSANDYDYASGDPINNFDLDGERCWTGVARRETYEKWNEKKQRFETKTKEICRSAARGLERTVRAFADDPGKYFRQCLRGFATGAVHGVYAAGLGGLWAGAGECGTNVLATALIDAGVDKDLVNGLNVVTTVRSGIMNVAEGTTSIVEFRGPFYP
jgi:hypothetical protein